MNPSNVSHPIMIDLNIGDQLTSISCGHVVVELVKFIAYQRQQIPYVYPWLKQVINNRKDNYNEDLKESFQSERHFRIASSALENLDFLIKSLLQEMNGSAIPDEVCIALGSTPVTCREVYRLKMPSWCHKPQCHSTLIASDQKIQRNVFRALVTADKLSQVFFNPLVPTNMYVFIKKKAIGNQDNTVSDTFIHTSGCRIPKNSKIVVINFQSENKEGLKCCNDLKIFGDVDSKQVELSLSEDENELYEIESGDTATWYQSSYVMKGFKDCVVNGVSVANTWMTS